MTTKGDFIGFKINDIHSSELGIVRVSSSGSRYEEDLLPSFSDKTLKVEGANQTYYFGTNFTDKIIDVDFAFDEITEERFRKLKAVLGQNGIFDLTFDELPFKTWRAKTKSAPSIKYLCFDEYLGGKKQRVYKGEGRITFVCYYPYAYSKFNTLAEYKDDNKNEWAAASRLPETGPVRRVDDLSTTYTFVNAGDVPMDFEMYYFFPDNTDKDSITLTLLDGSTLSFQGIKKLGEDTGFRINSALNLVEGFTGLKGEEVLSGNIYNKYKTGGYFYKIGTDAESIKSVGMMPYKFDFRYLYL